MPINYTKIKTDSKNKQQQQLQQQQQQQQKPTQSYLNMQLSAVLKTNMHTYIVYPCTHLLLKEKRGFTFCIYNVRIML